MNEPRTLYDCLEWLNAYSGTITFDAKKMTMPNVLDREQMRVSAYFTVAPNSEHQVSTTQMWFSHHRALDPEGMFTAIMCRAVAEMQQRVKEEQQRGQEEERQVSACLCDEFPCEHDTAG